jgi:hypothetical protein
VKAFAVRAVRHTSKAIHESSNAVSQMRYVEVDEKSELEPT